jgi:hypothetical protein
MKPYASRAHTATYASKAGVVAFESLPADGGWRWQGRDPGPGLTYALLYARGKDWINHCEVRPNGKPILVVRVTKPELPGGIPALFELRPVTPSLWDRQEKRQHAPKPSRPVTPAPFRPDLKYVLKERLDIIFPEGACLWR